MDDGKPWRLPTGSARKLKHPQPPMDEKSLQEKIGIYVRLRPVFGAEEEPSIRAISDTTIALSPPHDSKYATKRSGKKEYACTGVFGADAGQHEVFRDTTLALVQGLFDGIDGLLFTHGMTGSGKTFTIEGPADNPGLLTRTLNYVFASIHGTQGRSALVQLNDNNSIFLREPGEAIAERRAQRERDRQQQQQQQQQQGGSSKKRQVRFIAGDYEDDSNALYSDLLEQPDATPATPHPHHRHSHRSPSTDALSSQQVDRDYAYFIFVSYGEVYKGFVYDLLGEAPRSKQLPIKEDKDRKNYIAGLTQVEVKSVTEALAQLRIGQRNRQVSSTHLNDASSRSHAVFTLKLIQLRLGDVSPDQTGPFILRGAHTEFHMSSLSFIDLAGSERADKYSGIGSSINSTTAHAPTGHSASLTPAERSRQLKEANSINQSLTYLSVCFNFLAKSSSSSASASLSSLTNPFRNCKLTMLFKSHFLGNSKIRMIICVNPTPAAFDQTYGILQSAMSIKGVTTMKAQPVSRGAPTGGVSTAGSAAVSGGKGASSSSGGRVDDRFRVSKGKKMTIVDKSVAAMMTVSRGGTRLFRLPQRGAGSAVEQRLVGREEEEEDEEEEDEEEEEDDDGVMTQRQEIEEGLRLMEEDNEAMGFTGTEQGRPSVVLEEKRRQMEKQRYEKHKNLLKATAEGMREVEREMEKEKQVNTEIREQYRRKMDEGSRTIAKLRGQVAQLEIELEEAKNELLVAVTNAERSRAQTDTLQADLKGRTRELQAARAQCDALESERDKMDAQRQIAEERRMEAEAKRADMLGQVQKQGHLAIDAMEEMKAERKKEKAQLEQERLEQLDEVERIRNEMQVHYERELRELQMAMEHDKQVLLDKYNALKQQQQHGQQQQQQYDTPTSTPKSLRRAQDKVKKALVRSSTNPISRTVHHNPTTMDTPGTNPSTPTILMPVIPNCKTISKSPKMKDLRTPKSALQHTNYTLTHHPTANVTEHVHGKITPSLSRTGKSVVFVGTEQHVRTRLSTGNGETSEEEQEEEEEEGEEFEVESEEDEPLREMRPTRKRLASEFEPLYSSDRVKRTKTVTPTTKRPTTRYDGREQYQQYMTDENAEESAEDESQSRYYTPNVQRTVTPSQQRSLRSKCERGVRGNGTLPPSVGSVSSSPLNHQTKSVGKRILRKLSGRKKKE